MTTKGATPSPAPARVYGGVAAGERIAERRAKLLEAGLELVGRSETQTASVRAVCAEAGLTPRYFYESFDGLPDLLAALLDGVAVEAAQRVLESVTAAPDDAGAKAEAAIGAFVDLLVEDPRRARLLFTEAVGEAALMERRRQLRAVFVEMIAAQGREFYGGEAPGDDRIVEVTALMLGDGLAGLLLAWVEGELEMDRDALVADASALFVATGQAAVEIARRRAT